MKIEHSCTNKIAQAIIRKLERKAVYWFQPDDSPDEQEAAEQLMNN